ncbi:WYL domain-containing protein [Paratractidigestivibacter sp.]|uniref:helix-turn-helix transcriptional regulator n=1 Tax=Paratractidigestivibacter sp. TaxID=2847316 RepID=UPI002ABE692C|nr:WYL domain-containing protein [Paratractidigestivibacter sp.]
MANKKNAGRRGAAEIVLDLLSLASSLSDPGDYVSEGAIQKRFGCSPEQAAKLYALLTNLVGDPSGITAYEDEEGLVVGSTGSFGRALRLNASETFALVSALNRLGIDENHPLRAKLQGSLANDSAGQELARRMIAVAPETEVRDAVSACSAAIAALHDVEFEYRKAGGTPELRHVRPERFSLEDGAWYLHGIDLDKRAERVFRLDRMDEVRAVARGRGDEGNDAQRCAARRVELEFYDKCWLDLFQWPGLELRKAESSEVVGTVPYFGGMWLPQQIAGCGGDVVARDPEVDALIREYAAAQLRG